MPGLNAAQRAAVQTTHGPMLVLAGAGSGKTRVITHRIARLIASGVPADRILGVTFTNKAANEMQNRLKQMLRAKKTLRPLIATFHSLCVRILRRHIEKIGYPAKFVIYNRGDQESLAREVLRELNVADSLLAPAQMLYQISNWKSRSIGPDRAAIDSDNDKAHLAAIAYDRYQQLLRSRGCVDFDDLLLLTEQLFAKHPESRKCEARKFDHILVDEYQDTNGSQYRLVSSLAESHRNLCVVGDDDQSIYGWRGAEVQHILNFHHDWPDARVFRLEKNYRSTAAILQFANALIQHNPQRHEKILRAAIPGGLVPQIIQYNSETHEATETVASIKQRLQDPKKQPRDFAILFRTNEQPRLFETELRKARLPYVLVGGMSFFDRKEVKDLLAYVRLIDGQCDDISVLRVINTPPRGIGKSSIEKLISDALAKKVDLWNLICERSPRPTLPATTVHGLDQFRTVVEQAAQAKTMSLSDRTRMLINSIQYPAELERLYRDPNERQSRLNSVEQFVNAVAEYQAATRQGSLTDFLDKLLVGDQDLEDEKEKQLKRNAIALMTIHSAKGLEFPEVYLVGMEEGVLPHHRSLNDDEAGVAEERRLCYVAVTRAQRRLTLSFPLTRLRWGKPKNTQPSRFLYELTSQKQPAGTGPPKRKV